MQVDDAAPRKPFGKRLADDEREMLPIRQSDGKWQQRTGKKHKKQLDEEKAAAADDAAADDAAADDTEHNSALEEAATEVESAAATRSTVAKLSSQILEAPHKHVGLLNELLQHAADRDAAPSVQRLALLSAAAVLRDLIPAYRIRLPTEKELKMQVSKEVSTLREYERKLLSAYDDCVATLKTWVNSKVAGHRAAGVRGLGALLDKAYDFNGREALLSALIPVANSSDDDLRKEACGSLRRLYEQDSQGDATLIAVREASNLLKHSSFNVRPELLATWLHLKVEAASAGGGDGGGGGHGEGSSKKAKKRKRQMDPVARELAAAAGERGDRSHMASKILEQVFVSYARVIKRGASSPLLPAVLKGIAKYAHQVNVELLLDLFANLRELLNTDGALTEASSLHCIHALLQLLSGHGAALAVDAKDVQYKLYSLLGSDVMFSEPPLLATALDCVEHLAKKNRAALLAPRVASIVRRLLKVAVKSPIGHTIAILNTCARLLVACPRIGTMLEPPEDETASGPSALDEMYGNDMDSPAVLHSTCWELMELKKNNHATVADLARKLSAKEPFPPRFNKSTPLQLIQSYADANLAAASKSAAAPSKPHKPAAAKPKEAAKKNGGGGGKKMKTKSIEKIEKKNGPKKTKKSK